MGQWYCGPKRKYIIKGVCLCGKGKEGTGGMKNQDNWLQQEIFLFGLPPQSNALDFFSG